MKLLLLILALTVYQITPAAIGGYNLVDPSELNQDKSIQDILSFGAQYVIEQGIQAQDLPDLDYEVTAVYSVYRQVVNGINYMFDVEIRGAAGIIIRSSYIVYDQLRTNIRKVTSYNYDIEDTGGNGDENLEFLPDEVYWSEEGDNGDNENEEATLGEIEWGETQWGEIGPIVGGYTPVDLEKAKNDPVIQELLSFGAQFIVTEGINGHRLPDSLYQIGNVYSVQEQVVAGMNYQFDVELVNCHDLSVRATYVVYYVSSEDTKQVGAYSFDITGAPNGFFIGGCPNDEGEEESTVGEEGEEGQIFGVFSPVDLQDAEKDQQLQDALSFGIQELAKEAIADGILLNDSYSLYSLLSAQQQVVSGMNYKFYALLSGGGMIVRVTFEVYSQPWIDTKKLITYSILALGPAWS